MAPSILPPAHSRGKQAGPGAHARFVGRVGALAVFLGVGTAIGAPGIAYADDGGSGGSSSSDGSSASSSSSSSPSSSSDTAGSASESPTGAAPESTVGTSPKDSGSSSGAPSAPKRDIATSVGSSPTATGSIGSLPSTKSDEENDGGGAQAADPKEAADTSTDTSSTRTAAAQSGSANTPEPETSVRANTVSVVSAEPTAPEPAADPVVDVPAADPVVKPADIAPEKSTPARDITDAVTSVVVTILSAFSGSPAPTEPAASPAQWALLAAARREAGIDATANPAVDTATQPAASTVVPQAMSILAPSVNPAVYPTETNPLSIIVNQLIGPFLPYTAKALTTTIDMVFTAPLQVAFNPFVSAPYILGSLVNGVLKDIGAISALPYAKTGWVTLHGDPGNKKDQSGAELALDYDISTALGGAAVLAAPTILPNGNIVVATGLATGGSNLNVLDRQGNIVWQSAPWSGKTGVDSGAILNSPIVDTKGNIFISDGDQLWSYTQDGNVRWVRDLPAPPAVNPYAPGSRAINPFVTAAFTSDGDVFGVTVFGQVVVANRDTGELVAPVYQIPGPLAERSTQPIPPGVFGGGLADQEIVDPIFQVAYGGIVRSANTPAVDAKTGRIFVAATDLEENMGALYGFDIHPATPFGPGRINVAFVTQMGPGSGSSPTLSPDGRAVYASDNDGILYSFDTRTGKVIWSVPSEAEAASVAVGPNGNIYVLKRASVMSAFDSTGQLLWDADVSDLAAQTLPTHAAFGAPTYVGGGNPTVVNGAIVEPVFYGYNTVLQGRTVFLPVKVAIVEFDPATGKALRNLAFTNGTTEGILNVGPDGTMYVSQGAITSSSLAALAPFINPALAPYGLSLVKPIGGVNIFTPVRT